MHTKVAGKVTDHAQSVPLNEIKGAFALISVNFAAPRQFVSAQQRKLARWKKSDTAVLVDVRSIPADVNVSVWIGLLEQGNTAALASLMSPRDEGLWLRPQQLVVSSAMEPWIFVVVSWSRPLPETNP
jgi:hypothetical protein